MNANFDYTDKAQETLSRAIQVAKDYANSQGTPLLSLTTVLSIADLVLQCILRTLPSRS